MGWCQLGCLTAKAHAREFTTPVSLPVVSGHTQNTPLGQTRCGRSTAGRSRLPTSSQSPQIRKSALRLEKSVALIVGIAHVANAAWIVRARIAWRPAALQSSAG